MRIKPLHKLLLFFLFLCAFTPETKASHLYGGEFTYEYLGQLGSTATPFRYRIIYRLYREANNGTTVDFNFYLKNGSRITSASGSSGPTSPGSTLHPPVPPGCVVPNVPTLTLETYTL